MPLIAYENEKKEILVKGIPLKNIIIGSGVLVALTLIILIVKR